MTTKRDRLYIEMQCGSCKRPHMITRQALADETVIKRCPHCQSPKVHATGMLGFTATQGQVQAAKETATALAQEYPDEEAALTERIAETHTRRKPIGSVLNPEG